MKRVTPSLFLAFGLAVLSMGFGPCKKTDPAAADAAAVVDSASASADPLASAAPSDSSTPPTVDPNAAPDPSSLPPTAPAASQAKQTIQKANYKAQLDQLEKELK